jgi:hypothetical protein
LKPRFANYPACRHGGLPVLFEISGAAVSQPLTIRAGLPAGLLPAFRAALEAQREIGLTSESAHTVRLSRTVIERVLTACEDTNAGELNPLLAVLRRFETEALRRRGPRARVRFAASGARGNGHSPADGIDRARASRAITIDLDALEAEILQAA